MAKKNPPKIPDLMKNKVRNHIFTLSAITGGWLTSSFTCLATLFWTAMAIKYCQKMPKNSQNGKKPPKIPDFVKNDLGNHIVTLLNCLQ